MDANKKNIAISIIIPVFNTEKYIARCLDSIINQSLKSLEIILIDDLSTDNSAAIIAEYVKKYDFIQYLKMKSKGSAGGARNLGLEKVSGEYIGFVDSDDWVDTMLFEKMLNAAKKHDADIAMCGVISEFENSHESVKRHEFIFENVIEGKAAFGLLTRVLNQDIVISPVVCNKIYRTKFIKDNHYSFLMNNYNDDDVFNFICLLQANKVAIVPNTYYHYYQRPDSIMHRFSTKHIDDFLFAYKMLKNFLEEKNCFSMLKNNYYMYMELNLAALLRILLNSEPILAKQNEHIIYLLNQLKEHVITNEYINYVGPQRLIQFLTTALKR